MNFESALPIQNSSFKIQNPAKNAQKLTD